MKTEIVVKLMKFLPARWIDVTVEALMLCWKGKLGLATIRILRFRITMCRFHTSYELDENAFRGVKVLCENSILNCRTSAENLS